MAGLIDKEKFEKAYDLHQRILVTAQMAQKNLYDMCVMLKQMRDDKLYKELGYYNFEEYCEEEVGMNRRNAYRYISVIENIKNVTSMSQIGMTKLSLLASLSESQQEEIQEKVKVEDVSVRELKAEIKKLKEDKEAAEKQLETTEHQLREENTLRVHEHQQRLSAESDLLSMKSKNRALTHELEDAKKHMSPDAKTQDALIRQLDRQLSEADQEHANALERQRKEYQAKINALQEQLNNAASMTEVAVETVEVPATKEIFEAYCNVVENSFGVLLDFVSYNKEYIKSVSQLLDRFDDLLTDI